jgi:hypothetical protein
MVVALHKLVGMAVVREEVVKGRNGRVPVSDKTGREANALKKAEDRSLLRLQLFLNALMGPRLRFIAMQEDYPTPPRRKKKMARRNGFQHILSETAVL